MTPHPPTLPPSHTFIIVERDTSLKDVGVFTGQIQIVPTKLFFLDDAKTIPLQAMDGVSSPDLEHAFVFNSAAIAWRFAMQFEPHWNAGAGRYWGARRWVVRRDLAFFPGECHHGINVSKAELNANSASWIPQEALLAATASGFEQGRQSALLERGSS